MPQFDTFSFFSQLFWVFASFAMLYLSLSYYLLPSIAITLKVRRRKLFLQSSALATTMELTDSSYTTIINTGLEKILQLPMRHSSNETGTFSTQPVKIAAYILKDEAIKRFSSKLYKQAFLEAGA
jgi:hypothetical protein